jgi:intracellular sulfur oxidation DsrE/DsrF family protein
MSWLSRITGRHKQVYDIAELGDGQGLRTIRNYLNAYRDVFNLNPPEVTAVAAMIDGGLINFNDAIWTKYGFGEESKTKDPQTGAWATRNIFRHAEAGQPLADSSVEALQARGVIFWQCNNALKGLTRRMATKMQMAPDAVRAELIAGLLPGVYLVPAHTMAIGMAQEHGCTYEALG